jgi:hypothetical protein
MGRIGRVVVGLGLIAALQGAALLGTGPALASDEDVDDDPGEMVSDSNPDFEASAVSGLVYKIEGDDALRVVTIYNNDIGLAVKAYVRGAEPLAMVKRQDVCVGRFVTAHGMRISDTLMEADGFDIDRTTQCGTPPK